MVMQSSNPQLTAADPADLVKYLFNKPRRALLFGQPGIGKTTLAERLARQLAVSAGPIWCLSADPGSPAFGVPGAVCLGAWQASGWSLQRLEALCTLDAARFRLPLATAVRNLAAMVTHGSLLLDAPGVVRGVAGAELLEAMVEAAQIDLVLVLQRAEHAPSLLAELHGLELELVSVQAAAEARRPGKQGRARQRTGLWDRYLQQGEIHRCALQALHLLGTPPLNNTEAWKGRQVAFLQQHRTRAIGEVIALDGETLQICLPATHRPTTHMLVRDAARDTAGLLTTRKRFADKLVRYVPPTDLMPDAPLQDQGGIRPLVHVATAMAILVNGVFGDPLLHLRLRHQRRSLLFDLGDGSRLPARIAHQVSDVFITHAHVDHICGFLWLLRSRIGEPGVCRLYGPPGLAEHIAGLITGIHWDRIGERGPRFEVAELHGNQLKTYRLQAGQPGCHLIGAVETADGVLLTEAAFQVRAVTLDHGTPVLAFAYEPVQQLNVRKERLRERGLPPGPWLNTLKAQVYAGEETASIELPDGSTEPVAQLAKDLILVSEANRLVYATDFADIPPNRQNLLALAQDAHTLFCEASFLQQDHAQARRTGHLTTRACAEIARQARVKYLIPFHFSRRYTDRPWRVYEEIGAIFPRVVMPNWSA
jgi:ribonuclease BN (tRNA processing enzyme)/polynucleotide 5'-kinase involved in rRNA processing